MSTTTPLYSTQWVLPVLLPRCTQLNEYYAPVVLNSMSTPNLSMSTPNLFRFPSNLLKKIWTTAWLAERSCCHSWRSIVANHFYAHATRSFAPGNSASLWPGSADLTKSSKTLRRLDHTFLIQILCTFSRGWQFYKPNLCGKMAGIGIKNTLQVTGNNEYSTPPLRSNPPQRDLTLLALLVLKFPFF